MGGWVGGLDYEWIKVGGWVGDEDLRTCGGGAVEKWFAPPPCDMGRPLGVGGWVGGWVSLPVGKGLWRSGSLPLLEPWGGRWVHGCAR